MKYTNNHGIPKAVFEALTAGNFDPRKLKDNILWLTKLIGPPLPGILQKNHWDELEEDVSDAVFRFIGSAVHSAVEAKSDSASRLTEERAYLCLDDFSVITLPVKTYLHESYKYDPDKLYVTTKLDCYDGIEDAVEDYKVTSVWGYIFENGQPKPDDIVQINVYRYVLRKIGFEVKGGMRIVYWFRDFQASKVGTQAGYPSSPVVSVPVTDVWPEEKVEAYLIDRAMKHTEAMVMEEHEVPICTPEERWAKPASYAVMKAGRKTAVRVHDSLALAEQHVKIAGAGHSVVKRPGQDIRCERYCIANRHCRYWREMYGDKN